MNCAVLIGASWLFLAPAIHSASPGRPQGNLRPPTPTVEQSNRQDKPNPLTLFVQVRQDRKILLNRDEYGTLADPSPLLSKLRDLFASRERLRAYKIGMETRTDLPESERIEKTVLIRAHESIEPADIAKLLEEITATGANPVTVLSEQEYQAKFGWLDLKPSANPLRPITGEFRNGIIHADSLNGSATKFPRPVYPEIAKSEHVSGEVKVDVVIDETGKVISATAVSGHRLLRPSSVGAARQAEFPPTLHAGKPVKVSGFVTYTFVR